MKKFTCKEIMNGVGGCDMEFEGDSPIEVAGKCGQHVASSTDEAHKPNRDQMQDQMVNGTKEDREKWFEWFQSEWDKKY
jgi:predicted small metal-binding protein